MSLARLRSAPSIVLLALALVACGSTVPAETRAALVASGEDGGIPGFDPPQGPSSPSPGAPGPGGALPPGGSGRSAPPGSSVPGRVTADRSPLKLGLIYVNNDAASSVGISNGNNFTIRRVLDALVTTFNARGGLANRRITPVYVEVRSSSSSYDADIQAACTTFVHDEKVHAVISALGLASEQLARCLTEAGIPRVISEYALGDERLVAEAPYVIAPSTLTSDHRETALLEQFTSTGWLRGSHTIGVVVEGCPVGNRTYDNTVVPVARRLGLHIEKFETECLQGIQDVSALASDMQSAVLRFNTRGVDRVRFVSESSEGNLMFLFSNAAESQDYRPGYALSSLVSAAVQIQNSPHAQLANARGVGWLPSIDTGSRTGTDAEAQCFADFQESGGPEPVTASDYYYVGAICDSFRLLDVVLTSTRGSANALHVVGAVARLGTSYLSAATLQGATDFRAGRRGGAARAREFVWDGSCTCFTYSGSSFQL